MDTSGVSILYESGTYRIHNNEVMMRVLHDNVLVTEVKNEKETTTEGGIILTTDVSTGHKPALVIAVGEGVDLSPRDKVYLELS